MYAAVGPQLTRTFLHPPLMSFYSPAPQPEKQSSVSTQPHPHQLSCSFSPWQRSTLTITQLGGFQFGTSLPAVFTLSHPADRLKNIRAADHLVWGFRVLMISSVFANARVSLLLRGNQAQAQIQNSSFSLVGTEPFIMVTEITPR